MNRRGAICWALFGMGLAVWIAALGLQGWVSRTVLPPVLAETAREVRDRNGALLRAYPVADGIWRLDVASDQVDPTYLAMLLRYEDKRFYSHSGVDLRAMLRAGTQAVWRGEVVSGGSTLTMQVARLLENGGTGRWAGKLRQIRVALALEQRLSKAQILQLYLLHAPFGGNIEGVRAASYAWFGKAPRRLTPSQAALLVALPQSPETRRPDRAPGVALAARNRVINRMAAAEVITAEQAKTALLEPIPDEIHPFPLDAPHLADLALAERPDQRQLDLTIDGGMQRRLAGLLRETVERHGANLSAALVLADHQSGEILASVGSPGYHNGGRRGYVDMTRAARSPGSTLKPLVYGLAFDQGMAHPETMIHDGPIDIDGYAPQNFDGRFRGDLRVRQALQLSLNTPVVSLLQDLGPARLMTAMRRSGARPVLPGGQPGLAVALGGVGVSLRDLVQIYALIAAGGQGIVLHHQQDQPPERSARILSEVAAWQLGDILRDLPPPPGAPARMLAYKTGTSYGHRDTWAIGWDGRYVIGVWLGRADGTPVPGAFGAELAAPLLFEAFGRMGVSFTPLPAPPPQTLVAATADLPLPLRRFSAAGESKGATGRIEPLQVVFPPDGAELVSSADALTLKLRGGEAPFVIMANDRPVRTGVRRRVLEIPSPGEGYSTFVVVDRNGQSDRVRVRIMPVQPLGTRG